MAILFVMVGHGSKKHEWSSKELVSCHRAGNQRQKIFRGERDQLSYLQRVETIGSVTGLFTMHTS